DPSPAPDVAEEFDVETRAIAKATLLACLIEPALTLLKFFGRNALRHEEDFFWINGGRLEEGSLYLRPIFGLVDDELELIITVFHERPDHVRPPAQALVPQRQPAAFAVVGRRVGQLGTQAG